jgi:hypothetical protein
MQFGETPTDDPAKWEQDSGMGKLQPSRFLSLRTALERALEFERLVIGLYNDKDHGTYRFALELLNAELEDEQNIEDILAKLEVRQLRTSFFLNLYSFFSSFVIVINFFLLHRYTLYDMHNSYYSPDP